jgi:hypothetical protein
MEVLHNPRTWKYTPVVLGALAEKAFVDTCEKQRKAYLHQRGQQGLDVEESQDYDERIELGRGMIWYYVNRQLAEMQAKYVPVLTEVSFDVPLQYEDGSQMFCKCKACRTKFAKAGGSKKNGPWRGNPVVISGRIDLVVHDMRGDYWLWDWKELKVTHDVLTPTGWVKMGDLKDGDLVIGQNGKPAKILGASPIYKDKNVWEVELEDGSVTECSGDHKWTVYDRDNKVKVMTTKELADVPVYQNFGLPVMSLAEFERPEVLVMHPYVLGSLIGDGHFGQKTLSYSSQSGETVRLLQEATTEPVNFTRAKETYNSWSVTGPWKRQLEALGLWGKLSAEKFIPKEYLFAEPEERIALLQGLYDTDGLASQLRICTTSEQLAKDICHLVRSLGGKASMPSSTERTHSNQSTVNKAEYFVNFWLPESIQHCRLDRKKGAKRAKRGTHRRGIVSVRRTDRVADMRCIAVDASDCLYVTENFVVTHNTAAQLSTSEIFLELDDQVATYCMAIRKKLNLNIRGFLYHEQRKAFPQPPKENKVRRLGRIFSVNVNQATDYDTYLATVKEHDTQAWQEGAYDDFLNVLKAAEAVEGSGFYRRFTIIKTPYELDQVEINLRQEVLDIIDPNLRIYPSPGRFSCNMCAFQTPCVSQNAGQDYQYTLDTMYEKREAYYTLQRREASTESKGRA